MGRARVWLADDSRTDARRATAALSDHHDVRVFTDGPGVLEQLATEDPPDALVLDWVMPDISGVDVVRLLRSSPRAALRELRVLLLTAMGQPEQVAEGLDAGADDYLAKPYSPIELRARVAALVRSRELDERVRSAERTIRRLLVHAPDPMFVVGDRCRISWVNLEAEEMVGAPATDLVGRQIWEVLPGLPWQDILTEGRAPDLPWRGRLYSPSVRIVDDEMLAGTVLSLRDVTEKRRADQRRLDFYSIIVHDLRSPLQNILLRSQLLVSGRHGALEEAVTLELERVVGAGRDMAALMDDFLQIARSETMGLTLQRKPLDLRVLVHDLVEEYARMARQKGVAVAEDLDGGPMEVKVDPPRMRQVIMNLLSNALKYTDPGGKVTVSLRQEPRFVRLEVRDTGRGIAAEMQPSLFQRYVRKEGDDVQGTGLGLMIVREIVEAHGGTVGVESELGSGSHFWVCIPLAAPGQ